MSNQKRILVAEDDKNLSKSLVMDLKKSGFDVDLVTNGEETMLALGQGKYDLLLLDIIMPHQDGFSVLGRIKKDGLRIPVIVLSNLGEESDKQKSRDLGATGFLVKADISLQEIVAKIKEILK
ncbi:response regulator [Candidatus Uhrbacteria bacterium]|nr:response regulator [Candidatus Uhrbacteria bacterium]